MNSEWNQYTLSQIGKIITGKTPSTNDKSNYDGDIPFLTPSDDLTGKYVLKTQRKLSAKGAGIVKNCILPRNTICVSCIGSDLGKVVITTTSTVTNQQFNSVIVDTDAFDVDFIYYALVMLGQKLNYLSKTSTAVPIVNKTMFSQQKINCPNLEKQRAIGRVLSTFDNKIQANKLLNDNLEKQLDLLFQNFISASERWDKGKLYDILNIKRNTISSKDVGSLPYLPIDSIPMNSLAVTEFRPSSEAKSSLLTFNKNDILIGAMRVYFHRVTIAQCNGVKRSTCFVLQPSKPEY